MKNTLIVTLLFILSFGVIYSIGEFLFGSDPDSTENAGALQAAVTFGGVNYLSIFVYILIAMALTAIIFFSVKSRRSN